MYVLALVDISCVFKLRVCLVIARVSGYVSLVLIEVSDLVSSKVRSLNLVSVLLFLFEVKLIAITTSFT